MAKFKEKFKNPNFGHLKMTHFPHFDCKRNFPEKSKTFTFTHFLMPFLRYNLKKI